jgi:hypothetical protein
LVIGAGASILNCDCFSLLKQRQKNININAILSQMADIEACGADLRGIVPKEMAIAGVARCRPRIRLI